MIGINELKIILVLIVMIFADSIRANYIESMVDECKSQIEKNVRPEVGYISFGAKGVLAMICHPLITAAGTAYKKGSDSSSLRLAMRQAAYNVLEKSINVDGLMSDPSNAGYLEPFYRKFLDFFVKVNEDSNQKTRINTKGNQATVMSYSI